MVYNIVDPTSVANWVMEINQLDLYIVFIFLPLFRHYELLESVGTISKQRKETIFSQLKVDSDPKVSNAYVISCKDLTQFLTFVITKIDMHRLAQFIRKVYILCYISNICSFRH